MASVVVPGYRLYGVVPHLMQGVMCLRHIMPAMAILFKGKPL